MYLIELNWKEVQIFGANCLITKWISPLEIWRILHHIWSAPDEEEEKEDDTRDCERWFDCHSGARQMAFTSWCIILSFSFCCVGGRVVWEGRGQQSDNLRRIVMRLEYPESVCKNSHHGCMGYFWETEIEQAITLRRTNLNDQFLWISLQSNSLNVFFRGWRYHFVIKYHLLKDSESTSIFFA